MFVVGVCGASYSRVHELQQHLTDWQHAVTISFISVLKTQTLHACLSPRHLFTLDRVSERNSWMWAEPELDPFRSAGPWGLFLLLLRAGRRWKPCSCAAVQLSTTWKWNPYTDTHSGLKSLGTTSYSPQQAWIRLCSRAEVEFLTHTNCIDVRLSVGSLQEQRQLNMKPALSGVLGLSHSTQNCTVYVCVREDWHM